MPLNIEHAPKPAPNSPWSHHSAANAAGKLTLKDQKRALRKLHTLTQQFPDINTSVLEHASLWLINPRSGDFQYSVARLFSTLGLAYEHARAAHTLLARPRCGHSHSDWNWVQGQRVGADLAPAPVTAILMTTHNCIWIIGEADQPRSFISIQHGQPERQTVGTLQPQRNALALTAGPPPNHHLVSDAELNQLLPTGVLVRPHQETDLTRSLDLTERQQLRVLQHLRPDRLGGLSLTCPA